MNKVKQRTLALFVVLALLLGGALALVNHQNQQEAAAASAAAEGTIPLSAFPMDSLSRLVLETGGETLTLEAGESWTLEEDPDYHLDATACDSMRTALSALNAKRQLTAETGEDYGFDAPQAVVTVTADGETHTFRFGAENTITGDVYLQKDEDPAVYTVAASKAAPFLTSKAALFGAFCPAGLTRSDIEAVSYTLASGETVTLQAVSERRQRQCIQHGVPDRLAAGRRPGGRAGYHQNGRPSLRPQQLCLGPDHKCGPSGLRVQRSACHSEGDHCFRHGHSDLRHGDGWLLSYDLRRGLCLCRGRHRSTGPAPGRPAESWLKIFSSCAVRSFGTAQDFFVRCVKFRQSLTD